MPEVHRGVNLTGKLRVLGFCQRLVKNKSPFLSIMRPKCLMLAGKFVDIDG